LGVTFLVAVFADPGVVMEAEAAIYPGITALSAVAVPGVVGYPGMTVPDVEGYPGVPFPVGVAPPIVRPPDCDKVGLSTVASGDAVLAKDRNSDFLARARCRWPGPPFVGVLLP